MSLFEDQVKAANKRNEAIKQLESDDFEEHNPESFNKSVNASKHPMMLRQYSNDELNKMKLFKVKGKNIGFALKKREGQNTHDELVLVHNNEKDTPGIGDHIVKAAIRHGATHADHFDGYLTPFYERHGFKEYHRDPYNAEYDPEGKFKAKYGTPDVVYVRRQPELTESFRDMVEMFRKH